MDAQSAFLRTQTWQLALLKRRKETPCEMRLYEIGIDMYTLGRRCVFHIPEKEMAAHSSALA